MCNKSNYNRYIKAASIKVIILLLPFIGFAQLRTVLLDSTLSDMKDYRQRLRYDTASMRGYNFATAAYYFLEENNLMDSTQLLFIPEAGIKTRADGTLQFLTKGYDLSESLNDVTQTTAADQPYLSGNIAPNERLSVKNPNKNDKYLTHSIISFNSSDKWTMSIVLNWEGRAGIASGFAGNNDNAASFIMLKSANEYKFKIYNSSNVSALALSYNTRNIIGKNTMLTFMAGGDGVINIYVNSVLVDSITLASNIEFADIFQGFATNVFDGKIYYYRINSGEMSQSQLTNEYNWIRSWIPVIEYIGIDGQNYMSSNYDVIQYTGEYISQATDNADWAGGSARWDYYNNSDTLHMHGKLYNNAAKELLGVSAYIPDGWSIINESEAITLSTKYQNQLKKRGADYWNTANGTNITGFTALGGGMRNIDGTFSGLNDSVDYWCGDSVKVLRIRDSAAATVEEVDVKHGAYIRLTQRKYNIILVAGQSNIDGRVSTSETNTPLYLRDNIIDNIQVWNGTGLENYDLTSIGQSGNGSSWVQSQSSGNYSFASVALYELSRKIPNIIVCQVTSGGTPLKAVSNTRGSWNYNYSSIPINTPALLSDLNDRYDDLITYLNSNNMDYNVTCMLWHQGESDDASWFNGESVYDENFTALINVIRNFTGKNNLPIFYGTVPSSSAGYSLTIRNVMLNKALSDNNLFCRDNNDLILFDTYHFDDNSCNTFGSWVSETYFNNY